MHVTHFPSGVLQLWSASANSQFTAAIRAPGGVSVQRRALSLSAPKVDGRATNGQFSGAQSSGGVLVCDSGCGVDARFVVTVNYQT